MNHLKQQLKTVNPEFVRKGCHYDGEYMFPCIDGTIYVGVNGIDLVVSEVVILEVIDPNDKAITINEAEYMPILTSKNYTL